MRILYFGREGCEFSLKIERRLKCFSSEVVVVRSQRRFEQIPSIVHCWKGDLIICFRSHYILTQEIISSAKIAAINFHPGPPNYRGTGCLNFALFNEEKEYGVTVHFIAKKVDSGKIIKCIRFPIEGTDGVDSLLEKTHEKLFEAFLDFYEGLVFDLNVWLKERLELSSNEAWSGKKYTVSELNALQILDWNASEADFARVIRATNTKNFPTEIKRYGYSFLYTKK